MSYGRRGSRKFEKVYGALAILMVLFAFSIVGGLEHGTLPLWLGFALSIPVTILTIFFIDCAGGFDDYPDKEVKLFEHPESKKLPENNRHTPTTKTRN